MPCSECLGYKHVSFLKDHPKILPEAAPQRAGSQPPPLLPSAAAAWREKSANTELLGVTSIFTQTDFQFFITKETLRWLVALACCRHHHHQPAPDEALFVVY